MSRAGFGAGPTERGTTLNVPDRTADLFGDQAIRDEFEQALKAAGRFHQRQRVYLEGGPIPAPSKS
ncbi:hypothetical protein [Streptomyces sp. NBC_00316]|uniref:hypothetical protein n=1 Tax=Streptomyces sp. NBC_00316 TaxID=2975710 RepID=UPI002E2E2B06|nr:hypothetical protein [Streptomyces sp. NBC_00316]